MEKIIPVLLIILDVLAAAGYAYFKKDYSRVIYWLSAAVLTASVTYSDQINSIVGNSR